MIIFLNPYANHGRSGIKWQQVKAPLLSIARKFEKKVTIEPMKPYLIHVLDSYVRNGETVFIAAGGDGSVHHLINAVMQLDPILRKKVIIGAIGLGSSNDFHKPEKKDQVIDNVPYRLDPTLPMKHNLGFIELMEKDIPKKKRKKQYYFIINASLGIVAEGNDLFNRSGFVNRLKAWDVNGAIIYSALKTMVKYRNFPISLTLQASEQRKKSKQEIGYEDEKEKTIQTLVSNLSIVINPHFTGNLKYDTPGDPEGDMFCVNLCENMGFFRRLITFYYLGRGKFMGLPQTRWWRTRELFINSILPAALEMDGEVIKVRKVRVKLIQGGVKVCT